METPPRTIVRKGIRYTLDSKGRYYHAPRGTGLPALHVQVYIDKNGPVPEGHLVHHWDHDRFNNHWSNLVAVTWAEHAKLHKSPGPTPEVRALGREAAAAWHRSEAGRAWHREHAINQKREPRPTLCSWCGESFLSPMPGRDPSSRCCGSPACRKKRQSYYDRKRSPRQRE